MWCHLDSSSVILSGVLECFGSFEHHTLSTRRPSWGWSGPSLCPGSATHPWLPLNNTYLEADSGASVTSLMAKCLLAPVMLCKTTGLWIPCILPHGHKPCPPTIVPALFYLDYSTTDGWKGLSFNRKSCEHQNCQLSDNTNVPKLSSNWPY